MSASSFYSLRLDIQGSYSQASHKKRFHVIGTILISHTVCSFILNREALMEPGTCSPSLKEHGSAACAFAFPAPLESQN